MPANADSQGVSRLARHAAFTPLEEGGRVVSVSRQLEEAIALGLLDDGEQLPSESDLAAHLNVATVTLREALSALRHHGLVETRRGRGGGSFVRAPKDSSLDRARHQLRELDVHELREIGDQHTAVSGRAALLAAERATTEERQALWQLTDRLESATTPADRRRADSRFHIELAAAAQSTRLARQEITLHAEVGELLWMPSGEAVPHAEAVEQHRGIVGALDSGNGACARELAEQHVTRGIERLIDFHLRIATP